MLPENIAVRSSNSYIDFIEKIMRKYNKFYVVSAKRRIAARAKAIERFPCIESEKMHTDMYVGRKIYRIKNGVFKTSSTPIRRYNKNKQWSKPSKFRSKMVKRKFDENIRKIREKGTDKSCHRESLISLRKLF